MLISWYFVSVKEVIYLDNNATTKIDPRVLEKMMPFLTSQYANPASAHEFGASINREITTARTQVANLVGCESRDVVFTSGATEAINLAIKGVAEKLGNGTKKHIVTVQTEHHAVLDTCKHLEGLGFEVSYLPVERDGLLDLNTVSKSIRTDTLLVCVMLVNNELGVIQPIREISEVVHSKGAYLMTDATQAAGKIPFDVEHLGIDLLCLSGHKIYGPKGIGALCVSRQRNGLKLTPLIHGGGHENGMRSGTLNTPAIIGFGMAAEIASKELVAEAEKTRELRDNLENHLLKLDFAFRNGSATQRVNNVSNICFKGVDAESIISGLRTLAVSNGSACTSSLVEPSHVLKAIGLTDEEAFSSIRFSVGRFNTKEEIEVACEKILSLLTKLRMMPAI